MNRFRASLVRVAFVAPVLAVLSAGCIKVDDNGNPVVFDFASAAFSGGEAIPGFRSCVTPGPP